MELTIVSDGTPRGTEITDTKTGKVLHRVAALRLQIKEGEPYGTVEIVIKKPRMKLSGTFKVVEDFDFVSVPQSIPAPV